MPKIIDGVHPTTVVSLDGHFSGNKRLEAYFATDLHVARSARTAIAAQGLDDIKPIQVIVMSIRPEITDRPYSFSVEPREDWIPEPSTETTWTQ